MSLIGLITATGRLHRRPIQWHFKNNWRVPESLEKVISNTEILAPTFTMVAAREQGPYRPNVAPNKTCSANLYRCIKRRVGCSRKRMHCKRHLVPSGKQVAYQVPRTQGSLSSLKRVPRPLHTQYSICRDRQHHSGVIHKQGRRHEVGPTWGSTMENLDLVLQKSSDSQSQTHFRPAECGSRQAIRARPDHPNSGLSFRSSKQYMQQVASASNRPICHRFSKSPLFVSPNSLTTAVDAQSLPWEDLDGMHMPPHQQQSWAKWWRSCRTPHAKESF